MPSYLCKIGSVGKGAFHRSGRLMNRVIEGLPGDKRLEEREADDAEIVGFWQFYGRRTGPTLRLGEEALALLCQVDLEPRENPHGCWVLLERETIQRVPKSA